MWSQITEWPSKPVKLVEAFAPGGPAGIIARFLSQRLSAEYLFKSLAKVNILQAPYAGAGPALNAVMGDQIQLASVALPAAVSLVKAGKVKPLAERVSSMPDVPTIVELGFPSFNFATWVGVFAPSKTPASIVARLNSELNFTLQTPEVQQQMAHAGFSPIGGSLIKSSDYVKAELLKYDRLVKETGITAE